MPRVALMGALAMLLCAVALARNVTAATEPGQGAVAHDRDYIYLREQEPRLGYRRVAGEVDDATSQYVLFRPEPGDQTYLYTHEDVRLIELGADDRDLEGIVDRHWNDQFNLKPGGRGLAQWGTELLAEFLPAGLLIGLVVLVACYLVASALIQAYQRFVLEGHLKRLTTAKLAREIDKLQVEVLELRNRLGLPVEPETVGAPPAPAQPRQPLPATDPGGSRLPDLHVLEFLRHTVLGIPTADVFEHRKRRVLNRWARHKETHPRVLRFRHGVHSLVTGVAIVIGWIYVVGAVGACWMFLADPVLRESEGPGLPVFMLLIATALLVAVVRLGVKRRIRRAAFEELFYGGDEPSPGSAPGD